MMSERGEILEDLLAGGPLSNVDVVDCHVHLGPALYMQNPDTDADGLVRVLDSLGISMACVSHSVAMVSDWQLGNTLLIEAVQKYPDRIFGYAFFNPRYPDEMDAEMERCAAAGLRGLKMHPDFHDMPATSPLYDPLYERAEAEQKLLLCHYGAGMSPRCGSHLFKEVVQRFPRVRYIMAHSLPNSRAVDTAAEYFRDNEVYFDLANAFQPGVIEYARDKLGVERLLYGSDGCWGSIATRLGLVCATNLSDGDKRKILGGNMRGLMGRSQETGDRRQEVPESNK
jgi:predicted TIM-barrel fold metal-dependent hydrolase